MHRNAIKRAARVIFWKKCNYKKPKTRPEPVMSNPNPKKYSKTRPDPNPKKISKPKPDIWQPDPSLIGTCILVMAQNIQNLDLGFWKSQSSQRKWVKTSFSFEYMPITNTSIYLYMHCYASAEEVYYYVKSRKFSSLSKINNKVD